jgi:hypothetical protein
MAIRFISDPARHIGFKLHAALPFRDPVPPHESMTEPLVSTICVRLG